MVPAILVYLLILHRDALQVERRLVSILTGLRIVRRSGHPVAIITLTALRELFAAMEVASTNSRFNICQRSLSPIAGSFEGAIKMKIVRLNKSISAIMFFDKIEIYLRPKVLFHWSEYVFGINKTPCRCTIIECGFFGITILRNECCGDWDYKG